jgi:hypothetical protein
MSEVFQMIPASSKPLWILGVIGVVLLALLALFAYIAYSSRNVRFEISDEGLRIQGGLYRRLIPPEALITEEARSVNLRETRAYRPTIRTNGIGLPGYQAGWFKLHDGEKALLFVTDHARVVHLPTREGYALLLSIDQPEAFLQSIRKLSASQSPPG